MEVRYDMVFDSQKLFNKFVKWANKNNLNWQCDRPITTDDWKDVEDRVSVFWLIDGRYTGFETCASVTYNCKNITYLQINPRSFL